MGSDLLWGERERERERLRMISSSELN